AFGRIANERRAVPMLSVAAPASGTGKTTFIERLIPRLSAHDVRIAVIKSDAHGFTLDTEGKDTDRFTAAGAAAVAVSAPDGYFILQKTPERQSLGDIAAKIHSVDLYITESRSRGVLPIVSLYRGKGEPLVDAQTAVLFVKNAADGTYFSGVALPPEQEVLRADLDDLETAERLALFLMGRALYGADGAMFLTM
ncbi:putative molybdopterin-guanine dinucleotide biosynthesis protein B, partial [Selenomonas sp. FOBRC9]|uniref:molybdopterin-guanine dinucleotide biosynthesis protein B n=1 Tax=Selenomonas sp. FOBRC9 TaxID=936573 RepID=UPI00027A546D